MVDSSEPEPEQVETTSNSEHEADNKAVCSDAHSDSIKNDDDSFEGKDVKSDLLSGVEADQTDWEKSRDPRPWSRLRQRFSSLRLRRGGVAAPTQVASPESERDPYTQNTSVASDVRKPCIADYGIDGNADPLVERLSSDPELDQWVMVESEGICERWEGDNVPSIEAAIERVLVWMLYPSIHGIPKLGVVSAQERANELLAEHGHDIESAVRSIVAGSEASQSAIVVDFFLERIPLFGCPTVLLKNTWSTLRSVEMIAVLNGHDLEIQRVQHEVLWCLVPQNEDKPSAISPGTGSINEDNPICKTAKDVAKAMIKGALSRCTGYQTAADCFELASLLCGKTVVDDDGFVHVTSTPAALARDWFRRQSLVSTRALLCCWLPLLVLGSLAPTIFAFLSYAPNVFRRVKHLWNQVPHEAFEMLPTILLSLSGAALTIHCLGPIGPQGLRTLHPRNLYNKVRSSTVLETVQDLTPQVTACVVFSVHALLPACSAYSAVNMALPVNTTSTSLYWTSGWGLLHWLGITLVGSYNLAATLLSHLQNEHEVGSRTAQALLRMLEHSQIILKACCVFVAWTYVSLALDLVITWFCHGTFNFRVAAGHLTTKLGVVNFVAKALGADHTVNPLNSDRTIIFILSALSVWSQHKLLALLRRRELLLRLIGAERVMASTMCLLFKGVAALVHGHAIAAFLIRVAPPAPLCILIVAARKHSVSIGISLGVLPLLEGLGWITCLVVGLLAGACITAVILHEWYSNAADLGSPATRLAFLIPGNVSGRAKGLLKDLLDNARKRAVQYVAAGLLDRAIRFIFQRNADGRPRLLALT